MGKKQEAHEGSPDSEYASSTKYIYTRNIYRSRLALEEKRIEEERTFWFIYICGLRPEDRQKGVKSQTLRVFIGSLQAALPPGEMFFTEHTQC